MVSLFDDFLGLFLWLSDFGEGFDCFLGRFLFLLFAAVDIHDFVVAGRLDVQLSVNATGLACSCATFPTCLSESLELLLGLFLFQDVCFDVRVRDKVHAVNQFVFGGSSLLSLGFVHTGLEEALLASLFDFVNAFHGLHSLDHKVTIIARWNVALLLKLKDSVVCHFLAVSHAISFSPLQFARVLFGFE